MKAYIRYFDKEYQQETEITTTLLLIPRVGESVFIPEIEVSSKVARIENYFIRTPGTDIFELAAVAIILERNTPRGKPSLEKS
jgi:hypothetical protein